MLSTSSLNRFFEWFLSAPDSNIQIFTGPRARAGLSYARVFPSAIGSDVRVFVVCPGNPGSGMHIFLVFPSAPGSNIRVSWCSRVPLAQIYVPLRSRVSLAQQYMFLRVPECP